MLASLRSYRSLPALLAAALLLSVALPLVQQVCAAQRVTTEHASQACCCGEAAHDDTVPSAPCSSEAETADLEAPCCTLAPATPAPQAPVMATASVQDLLQPALALLHAALALDASRAATPVPSPFPDVGAAPSLLPVYLLCSVFLI